MSLLLQGHKKLQIFYLHILKTNEVLVASLIIAYSQAPFSVFSSRKCINQ